MKTVTANDIRHFLLNHYSKQLSVRGLAPDSVKDGFDLLTEGIVDSLGILDMIGAVENEIGFQLDMEGIDAQELTILDSFCAYVERAATARQCANGGQPCQPA